MHVKTSKYYYIHCQSRATNECDQQQQQQPANIVVGGIRRVRLGRTTEVECSV